MSVNVLYIIDSLTHGGTEKQLVQLIRHMDPEKVRSHLCTLKPSEGLYDDLDIPKICLDFISFGHPSILGKVARLRSFIREHDIRIVQTFFQDPFLLGALVKPFTGVKLIGSFRDLGFWRTKAESRKMRMAFPFFSVFIANSQAVKDHFVKMDGIRPEKIEVIYNGIDVSEIYTKTSEDIVTPPIVGIVANLNRPVKRVQDFVRAAARVHKERPDVRFVVVGDGHLRSELQSLGGELGLQNVLRFTGRLANPMEVVREFHVGVITSETEGFCNAILEYMSLGVPVVATNTGGNPEIVSDGKNGFLVPVGNIDQLAVRIIDLLRSGKALRQVNISKVKEQFSISRMLAIHENIYFKFVEANNAGGVPTIVRFEGNDNKNNSD